jgi:sugar O-acyltransferase (sialic acid O-acetyltransferase NeuD family)
MYLVDLEDQTLSSKLFIIGSYSTALEIKEIAKVIGEFKIFLVDKNSRVDGVISEDLLHEYYDDRSFLIFGIANQKIKEKIIASLKVVKINRINIISEKSFIASDICIGLGNFIAPNVAISNNVKIGTDCIINFNSVIGHDTIIGDNVTINPGAVISGNVTIGNNCLIGANSFIHQGIRIGNNVKIDAMTHVFTNILEENMICTSRNLRIYKSKGQI